MKRTIKMNLSSNSIKAAIKEIEKYKDELDLKIQLLVTNLTERGYDIMMIYTDNIEWEGNFKRGRGKVVEMTKDGYKGKIFVADSSAVFVEFGYGIAGRKTGYEGDKSLMSGLGYDYMDPSLDPTIHNNNIALYVDSDGKVQTTSGQVSYSYMYKTGELLKKEVNDIIKSTFGKSAKTIDVEF